MALATTKGKKFALEELKKRRKTNTDKKKIDDAKSPAGSPMHFYCISCNGLSDVLAENYITVPKKLCDECQALKDLGWLE